MMKSPNYKINLLQLLIILITSIMRTTNGNTEQFIIEHAPNVDPLAEINPETYSSDQEIIFKTDLLAMTLVTLNNSEIPKVNGKTYANTEFKLPEYNFSINNDTIDIELSDPIKMPSKKLRASLTATQYSFKIPKGIPKCESTVNQKIRIVIIDSLFGNSPYLKHKVKTLGTDVGTSVCLEHGGNVAKVMDEMIPYGNMEFYSYGVFNCLGKGPAHSIIRAVNAVISKAKSNPDFKYIINFSGEGSSNTPIDDAFKEAELAGIGVYVAAGNNKKNCMQVSPSRTAATSGVSSIGATCGDLPCSYTNFEENSAFPNGQCITVNLPGCVQITNIMNGKTANICGTSYATPIAAARHAIAQHQNPTATNSEIKKFLTTGVNKVQAPQNQHFKGMWDVLNQEYACPKPVTSITLFSGTKKLKSKKFKRWYNANASDGTFCITFQARSIKGPFHIGIRKDPKSSPKILIQLGIWHKSSARKQDSSKKYLHRLREIHANGSSQMLDSEYTAGKIAGTSFRKYTLQQNKKTLLINFPVKRGTERTILSAISTANLGEVAFRSINGEVRNARRCKL